MQWPPIMIAWNVSLWLPYLEISAVAKHGFPRLRYSVALNERFAANEPLFARGGTQRSGYMNICQTNAAALLI